jgi:hypothetical protein
MRCSTVLALHQPPNFKQMLFAPPCCPISSEGHSAASAKKRYTPGKEEIGSNRPSARPATIGSDNPRLFTAGNARAQQTDGRPAASVAASRDLTPDSEILFTVLQAVEMG